ncbi:MAG: ABC transporter substrate-binding protein [Actinobacteria bacterium]|nr:ABC transporter substrate-binding protein [Actinomycetota bacterium]
MTSSRKMLRGLLASLLVLSGLALAACSSNGGKTSTTTASQVTGSSGETSTSAADQPKYGGTLRWGWDDEPTNLDPVVPTDNWAIWTILNVFQQLVRSNKDGTGVEPYLAEKWELASDNVTWTFHLRDGATFSDGKPVTADDVVYSLERARGKTSSYSSFFSSIASVKSPDPRTVVITTAQPYAALLPTLAFFPASIVPKAVVEKDPKAFGDRPVGSGPYAVSSWERGTKLVLTKNQYFKMGSGPYLDGVEFVRVPEANTRLLQLEAGDLDVVRPVPFTSLATYEHNPDFGVLTPTIMRVDWLVLNVKRDPFTDVKIRQAINYAIDKEAIIKSLYAGFGSPANSILPKVPGWDESVTGYSHDLAKAKQLMAESTRPNGFKATLTFWTGEDTSPQLAQVVKQNLAAIGIDVTIQSYEFTAAMDKASKGEIDIFQGYITSDLADADELATLVFDPNAGTNSLFSFWDNAQATALNNSAKGEMDLVKRKQMYVDAQNIAVTDAPFVPLIYPTDAAVRSKAVQGLSILPTSNYRLEEIWLDK